MLTKSAVFLALSVFIDVTLSQDQARFFPADRKSSWWRKYFSSQADPSTCPAIEPVANGTVETNGNTAVYRCNPTFTLVGRSDRQCACGDWIGSAPECRKDGEWGSWSPWSSSPCTRSCDGGRQTRRRSCDDPPPDVGAKTCLGSSSESRECNSGPCPNCPIQGTFLLGALNITATPDGRRLFVSCGAGFFLSDPNLASFDCSGLNNTDEISSFCTESCRDLTAPTNGTVELSEGGLVANYQCDLGFILTGSTRLVCEDGEWIGDEATCSLAAVSVVVPNFPDFASLLGSNPAIIIEEASFVQSQMFFVPNCTTVLTFNYRTTAAYPIEVVAQLITYPDRESNNFSVIARGQATFEQIFESGQLVPGFFCLHLDECVNETLLPAAAGVRAFVRLESTDHILEITNLTANERRTCPDFSTRRRRAVDEEEDEIEDQDCDDSVESGDCGYTNDPCSFSPFAVSLVPEEEHESEDVDITDDDLLVGLQQKQTSESDDCNFGVCIPCFINSGVTVSKAGGSGLARTRKRRMGRNVNFHKDFCVNLRKGAAQVNSREIVVNKQRNEHISFGYRVNSGIHIISVRLTCVEPNNRKHAVHVGKDHTTPYVRLFTNGKISSRGRLCLMIHDYLHDFPKSCRKFRVHFVAAGKSGLCVHSIRYIGSSHSQFGNLCKNVHNKI